MQRSPVTVTDAGEPRRLRTKRGPGARDTRVKKTRTALASKKCTYMMRSWGLINQIRAREITWCVPRKDLSVKSDLGGFKKRGSKKGLQGTQKRQGETFRSPPAPFPTRWCACTHATPCTVFLWRKHTTLEKCMKTRPRREDSFHQLFFQCWLMLSKGSKSEVKK